MSPYPVGSLVQTFVNFSDPLTGVAIDPDTVTVTVTAPDGTATPHVYGTDVNVVRVSTGYYTYNVNTNAVGNWFPRWVGTGPTNGQSVFPDSFQVVN